MYRIDGFAIPIKNNEDVKLRQQTRLINAPSQRNRFYYLQLGDNRDKEAIPLHLLNPWPVVEDDDSDFSDLDISGESFMEVPTTISHLVYSIIGLLDKVYLDLSASKNSHTPELEEDDFTAGEKA